MISGTGELATPLMACQDRPGIATPDMRTQLALVREGYEVEWLALCRAVRWHLRDPVLVFGNQTGVFS